MKAAFELKSARLRLEALTLRLFSAQLDEIKQLLTDKAEQYQMFTSMPFILDASSLKISDNLDVKAVVALFAEHGLRVVALRHEEAHWADIARETGLLWLQSEKAETQVSQPENADAVEETAETQPENSSEEQTETTEETQPENAETSAEESEKAAPVLELTARPTLVITHRPHRATNLRRKSRFNRAGHGERRRGSDCRWQYPHLRPYAWTRVGRRIRRPKRAYFHAIHASRVGFHCRHLSRV